MDDLLKKGSLRLHWAENHMPVLKDVRKRFIDEQPLAGLKIGMALHTEAKTGMLAVTLADAGAKIRLASCNPLSTDDSVALALREEFGLEVYAKKWESSEEYYRNLNNVLDMSPDFIIDDGADLSAIKEMLGHSSLAATQVYTHNSVEKLKNVYNHAHPRAKNGEKHHGD